MSGRRSTRRSWAGSRSLPAVLAGLVWSANVCGAPAMAMDAAPAAANDSVRVDTAAYVRLGAWSGNRQLDTGGALAQAQFLVRSKADLGGPGMVRLDGWLRQQSHGGQRDLRGGTGMPRHARIRELYWQGGWDAMSVRLGRQNIVWGRADGLNPTNLLAPRDYTQLTPEDGDQYIGNHALRVDYRKGASDWSAVYFPRAASHLLPLRRTPGVSYDVRRPHGTSQFAVKWEGSADNIDGSVSYFSGVHPTPDIRLASVGPQGIVLALDNHRTRMIGADISMAAGGMIWRAEAARTFAGSRGAHDVERKRDQFWVIAGVEKSFGDALTSSVQISHQNVRDFADPASLQPLPGRELLVQVARLQAATSNQARASQTGLVWRFSKRAFNESLQAEINGVAFPGNGLLRTRLAYAISDDYTVSVGGDWYYGHEHTFFGQLTRNKVLFVQLQRGW